MTFSDADRLDAKRTQAPDAVHGRGRCRPITMWRKRRSRLLGGPAAQASKHPWQSENRKCAQLAGFPFCFPMSKCVWVAFPCLPFEAPLEIQRNPFQPGCFETCIAPFRMPAGVGPKRSQLFFCWPTSEKLQSPSFLGGDSPFFSTVVLFKSQVSPAVLMVSWKEGSLESMGKVPVEVSVKGAKTPNRLGGGLPQKAFSAPRLALASAFFLGDRRICGRVALHIARERRTAVQNPGGVGLLGLGQKPIPPVNIPIPTKID